jgi:hypothetical protein
VEKEARVLSEQYVIQLKLLLQGCPGRKNSVLKMLLVPI